jgi:hypothetical protein
MAHTLALAGRGLQATFNMEEHGIRGDSPKQVEAQRALLVVVVRGGGARWSCGSKAARGGMLCWLWQCELELQKQRSSGWRVAGFILDVCLAA